MTCPDFQLAVELYVIGFRASILRSMELRDRTWPESQPEGHCWEKKNGFSIMYKFAAIFYTFVQNFVLFNFLSLLTPFINWEKKLFSFNKTLVFSINEYGVDRPEPSKLKCSGILNSIFLILFFDVDIYNVLKWNILSI